MSRPVLIAAVYATAHGSNEWAAAVRALGQWRRQLDAAPPKPGRSTGLTRTQLYTQLLSSHHFDRDRPRWATVNPWATAAEFDALKTELAARAKAERAALKAQQQAA